tara:strand:+ start:849 stop:1007 length:159 start_codon:yes stop_codon:yes gene_type:complete
MKAYLYGVLSITPLLLGNAGQANFGELLTLLCGAILILIVIIGVVWALIQCF